MKVLITGASSGMGRDFAELLAAEYQTLVLVGRDQARLDQVRTTILAQYNTVDVITVATDLSVPANCCQLHAAHPDVDLLINNAGFGDFGSFVATDLTKDLAMINTNVVALHTLTKLYLGSMCAKNHGHILNVASIAGFAPGPLMATYYATKGYVMRLSEALREELRRQKSKVKISVLCPGPVATRFATTANVQFNFNGVDSRAVARYTLKHRNRFYIVPGWRIKLARLAIKCLPAAWAARVIYRIQAKRAK